MTGLDEGVEKDYRAKTSNQMDSRELRGTASESFMPDWQAARKVKRGVPWSVRRTFRYSFLLPSSSQLLHESHCLRKATSAHGWLLDTRESLARFRSLSDSSFQERHAKPGMGEY